MKISSPLSLEITKKLISFDTSKPAGIEQALTWIREWCLEHRVTVRTFSGTQALLLSVNPSATRHFSFVTHIDVVPADDWEVAFIPMLQDGVLVGRGAVDDKGPLGVSLEALLACRQLDDVHTSCLIVTDEETSNREIQTILDSKEFHADFCLVADGGTHTMVDIGQKGILQVQVEVKTVGGHSAFEIRGESATLVLLDFLAKLQALARSQPSDMQFQPTFINVSAIDSQTVPFGFPSMALANIQIQFGSSQTLAQWKQTIRSLTRARPHIHVTFEWESEPHLVTDPKVLALLHQFPKLSLITTGGNNLAKDLSLAGIPAVSHCPVRAYDAHCRDEHIGLDDLKEGVRFYTALVKQFSKNKNRENI